MCKVYTGYCGTSEIEHGLCACTVDNPLAKARGLSLRTGAQTMLYLSFITRMSPFLVLGVFGGCFHIYCILHGNSCKQTAQTLISVLWRLNRFSIVSITLKQGEVIKLFHAQIS